MSLFKIATGLIGGLTAGLLLAKRSGDELRKDLEGKTSDEKVKVFGKEIFSIGKDVLTELKKLPEKEQVQKLKNLGQEKLETLTDEIKKHGVKKAGELKDFGGSKLDELLPKLEQVLDEMKNNGGKIIDKKISEVKKGAKKIFKKEENLGSKMTKIFKK